MAKSKKVGGYNNLEEAQTKRAQLVEKLEAAKTDKKSFCKDNGLKTSETLANTHKLHGKWSKFQNALTGVEAEIAEVDAWISSNKPEGKKSSGPKKEPKAGEAFAKKYTYPSDVTTEADKKKYRAAQRAAAKKAEKGTAAPAPAAKKKSAAPAPEAPAAKSDKKKKKASSED